MTDYNDLTISEALSDPIIGLMMKADRVQPRTLEKELRAVALGLTGEQDDAGEQEDEDGPKRRSLRAWSDCRPLPAPPLVRFPPLAAIGGRNACGAACAW
ncbi:MAG: hypothetical protein BGP06_12280 [Rhizobiales bacterium 65-9]|nr:hypothetical protein [Hyphomicrobiales bacterium]OJY32592.1 MAG: hypothetical protein BGP06_12280 [Rhizobiales bacterium 65-9]